MSKYLNLLVILSDLVNVHVKTHETSEALLTKEPLSLKIALLDGLGGKDLGLLDLGPLTDPELHQCKFEYFHLLYRPPRGQRVVPK